MKKLKTQENIDLGNKLKQLRTSLGFTQAKAASEVLKVPLPTYRNWEQGVSRIPGMVWALLEKIYIPQ